MLRTCINSSAPRSGSALPCKPSPPKSGSIAPARLQPPRLPARQKQLVRSQNGALTGDARSFPHESGVHSLPAASKASERSEEHTSELQSLRHIVCRLLL